MLEIERDPSRATGRIVLPATIAAAVAAFIAATGGGSLATGVFDVSVRDWRRPALLAAVLLAVHAFRMLRRSRRSIVAVQALGADILLSALAVATILPVSLWWYYLVRACGGLDSHGYVSAAVLLAAGRVTLPLPALEWLPFADAVNAATPLGYVPSVDGGAAVPRFPLGLPIVMAVFRIIGGANGPFLVAPLLGTATVILVWTMVRSASGPVAAWIAAALVASHPVFIAYAIQPMSDVPATFWFVLSVFLLTRARTAPLLAGSAAGMAMLTRPTLGVAAVVLAGVAFYRRRTDGVRFVLGFGPLLGAHVAATTALYGSPAVSGYGTPAGLFSVAALPANVAMYARLTIDVHTLVLPALLVAAWFVSDRRRFVATCTIAAGVAAPYLFYALFYDDWETLRFLLPGLVLLLMLAADALAILAARVPSRVLMPVVVAIAFGVMGAASIRHLQDRQVFRLWAAESKYPAVADAVSRRGSDETVVLAALHSGSVRYYSGRTTVRWDQIPANGLAETVNAITNRGYPILLVLDGPSERDEFRKRFGVSPPGLRIDVVDRVQNVSLATVQRVESEIGVVNVN